MCKSPSYHHKPQNAAAAALCVTDSGHAAISYAPRKLDFEPCSQTATRSPGLPFYGLHPHNPCNYMDYYSFTDRDGMKG